MTAESLGIIPAGRPTMSMWLTYQADDLIQCPGAMFPAQKTQRWNVSSTNRGKIIGVLKGWGGVRATSVFALKHGCSYAMRTQTMGHRRS